MFSITERMPDLPLRVALFVMLAPARTKAASGSGSKREAEAALTRGPPQPGEVTPNGSTNSNKSKTGKKEHKVLARFSSSSLHFPRTKFAHPSPQIHGRFCDSALRPLLDPLAPRLRLDRAAVHRGSAACLALLLYCSGLPRSGDPSGAESRSR
jgi:hypothetical protein